MHRRAGQTGRSVGDAGRDTRGMSEPSRRTWTGGCLCGAVRYEARGTLRDVVNCHCSRCRRTHGHVAAYTEVASGELTLAEGRGLAWYADDGRERGFCRECGASVFWRRAGAGTTAIAAGTLDAPTGLRTVAHVFVESRGDYYEITDDLPRHPDSGARHPGGPPPAGAAG